MMLLIASIISLAIVIIIILGVALGGKNKESHKLSGRSAAGLFLATMLMYGVVTYVPIIFQSFGAGDLNENLALARYYKQSGSTSRAMQYYC
jgi:hypothetical protein